MQRTAAGKKTQTTCPTARDVDQLFARSSRCRRKTAKGDSSATLAIKTREKVDWEENMLA